MKRLTKSWVRKAEADFIIIQMSAGKPGLNDVVCFHCQQAAEKYLKALLQEFGVSIPRIHDLEELVARLLPHDSSLKKYQARLGSLTQYAVDYRYPGTSATSRQRQSAIRLIKRVRAEIRRKLGTPQRP